MRLWDRLTHRVPDRPPPAPAPAPSRDPDLDAVREIQHGLINRATALGLRADLRDRWAAQGRRLTLLELERDIIARRATRPDDGGRAAP